MSNLDKEEPVRIVKKVKGGHGGHHGGAWKVAYADFVTAMMALFIVLWILGQSEATKAAISAYFRDPGAFESTSGGALAGGSGLIPDAMPPKKAVQKSIESQTEALKKMGELIKKELAAQGKFAQLKDQITMEMVKEGLRIQLMESSKAFFFDIGTATLKPEAAEILKTIGMELQKMPNHVIIEGHTDARQYGNVMGYTNYELSADRANAARRVLVSSGMGIEKIDQVRGFADKHLQNNSDPYDVTNRRISIIVKYEGSDPE